jgi:hypothetical protein
MSAGLVPIDVAISTPTNAQSNSGADLSLNLNPAFLFGTGNLTTSPGSSEAFGSQNPSSSAPSSATATPQVAPGLSTLNTALPGSAIAQASLSSSTVEWLLIGGAVLFALSMLGGKK